MKETVIELVRQLGMPKEDEYDIQKQKLVSQE
jgi:hypothetical protein